MYSYEKFVLISLIIAILSLEAAISAQDEPDAVQSIQFENDHENTNDKLQQYSLYTAFVHFTMNQSSQCYKELQLIRYGYVSKEPWAMKVIDATGVRPSGFLFGNNLWLGSRDTCNGANYATYLPISHDIERSMEYGILNDTAPFDVQFKIAYLNFKSKWQVDWKFLPPEKTIIWGLCLPASCPNAEIMDLMQIYIKSDLFIERNELDIDATLTEVKDLGITIDFFNNTSVKILIGYLCFTSIMVIAATTLRLFFSDSDQNNIKPQQELNAKHLIVEFIKCFDVKYNFTKIFRINEKENGEISMICGLRSMNAIIIVCAHVVFFGIFAIVNRTNILSNAGRPLISIVYIMVEVFFILSGFLSTYNFLCNENQRQLLKKATIYQTLVLFFKRFFHRWLRLAPLYYLIVLLNTVLQYLIYKVSVYKLPTRDDLLISDSWWRFLLFIQNFLTYDKLPVNWSWTMACEMQFFLAGTILLFIYVKRPIFAQLLFVTVGLVSAGSYFYNGIPSNVGFSYDVAFNSAKEMYVNPLVRIISYLMGMLTAWYVVDKSCSLHSMLECAIGNVSIILFGILLTPLCDTLATTPAKSSLLILLLRLFFSSWICWLVVAAVTKRSTYLSAILEFKLFQLISRLSYAIYLVNPIISFTLASLTNQGISNDCSILIIAGAGVILLSACVAVGFSIAFELPYCNLSSLLLKPKVVKQTQ